MTITLRPYQRSVVREVSGHFQCGQLGVLLQLPTGSGKTRTAAYIVSRFIETGRQCLWTVHREELLMQAAMTFAEYGIPHRLICSTGSERAIKAQQFREHGRCFVEPGALVVIGSIQTIVRRLDSMPWLDPDLIVPDEAHLSLNATNRRIIGHLISKRDARLLAEVGDAPAARRTRVLGLTATPQRLDRQSFARDDGGLYDVMVTGPTVKELIEWGNLARFVAYAPPIELAEGADLKKRKGGDYDTAELEKELDRPKVYGDVVEHYRAYSDGKPAIGFCPTVASAEKFAQAFRAAGYRAIALDGGTDDGVRRRSLQQLGRGELDVVTSVSILVEGTDVPYATTALLLRRTESVSLYLQAVGRVLRPHPDKDRAIILDFVGNIVRPDGKGGHGLPSEEREWSLKPVERKARAASSEQPEPGIDSITNCPTCRAYHVPAPACPHCGHEYPVKARREAEQVDVDLVEITEAEAERMRRARRVAQGQAKSVPDLVAQGISRGRALKIVAAREVKAKLIDQVLDAVEAAKRPAIEVCGLTVADIVRAKPAELKKALQIACESGVMLAVVAKASGKMNGWFSDASDALDVAQYLRERFPSEAFAVVPYRAGMPKEIPDSMWID